MLDCSKDTQCDKRRQRIRLQAAFHEQTGNQQKPVQKEESEKRDRTCPPSDDSAPLERIMRRLAGGLVDDREKEGQQPYENIDKALLLKCPVLCICRAFHQ
jgi:hypothetical protein